uniref:Uncharacterized protein n=1 Tax=Burkholderia sp. M701 TaxID=326454 RepID=V5YN87_9BURK|nr:hypothetical protein [Burkholderia sp. M701]
MGIPRGEAQPRKGPRRRLITREGKRVCANPAASSNADDDAKTAIDGRRGRRTSKEKRDDPRRMHGAFPAHQGRYAEQGWSVVPGRRPGRDQRLCKGDHRIRRRGWHARGHCRWRSDV